MREKEKPKKNETARQTLLRLWEEKKENVSAGDKEQTLEIPKSKKPYQCNPM